MAKENIFQSLSLQKTEANLIITVLDRLKYAGVFSAKEIKAYIEEHNSLPKNVYDKILSIMGVSAIDLKADNLLSAYEVEKFSKLNKAENSKEIFAQIKEYKGIKSTKKAFTSEEVVAIATEVYKAKSANYTGEKARITKATKTMLNETVEKLNAYVEHIEQRKAQIAVEIKAANTALKTNPENAEVLATKASLMAVRKSLNKTIRTAVKSHVVLNALADEQIKDGKKEVVEYLTPENISSLNKLLDSLNSENSQLGEEPTAADALKQINKLGETKEKVKQIKRRTDEEDPVGIVRKRKETVIDEEIEETTRRRKKTIIDPVIIEDEVDEKDEDEVTVVDETVTETEKDKVDGEETTEKKEDKVVVEDTTVVDESGTTEILAARKRRAEARKKREEEALAAAAAAATDAGTKPVEAAPVAGTAPKKDEQIHEYQTKQISRGRRFLNFLGRHWLLATVMLTAVGIGALALIETAAVGVAAFNLGKFMLYNIGSFCTIFGLSSITAWALKYFPGRGKRQANAARTHFMNRERKVAKRMNKAERLMQKSKELKDNIRNLNDKLKAGDKRAERQLKKYQKRMLKLDKQTVGIVAKVDKEFDDKEIPKRYNVFKSIGYRIRASFGVAKLSEYERENSNYVNKKVERTLNENKKVKFEGMKIDGNLVDEVLNFHLLKERVSSHIQSQVTDFDKNEKIKITSQSLIERMSQFKSRAKIKQYRKMGELAKDVYLANPDATVNYSDKTPKEIIISDGGPESASVRNGGARVYNAETSVFVRTKDGAERTLGNKKHYDKIKAYWLERRGGLDKKKTETPVVPTEVTPVDGLGSTPPPEAGEGMTR